MLTDTKIIVYDDYVTLAQLFSLIQRGEPRRRKFVEKFLEKVHNINYQIPTNNYLVNQKPELIGCSALHLAFSQNNIQIFNMILEKGANFTVKNSKNMTVIHQVVEENFKNAETSKLADRFREYNTEFTVDDVNSFVIIRRVIEKKNFETRAIWRLKGKLNDPFVDAVLSSHIKYDNPSNPCSDNGITHFHAACMADNFQAVEYFFNNQIDINQAANMDSSIYAGFTPLHFAVSCSNFKTVKILLSHGANANLKNAAGENCLHIALDHNIKILEWLSMKDKFPYENCIKDFIENQNILNLLMHHSEAADNKNSSDFLLTRAINSTLPAENLLKNNTNVNDKLDFVFWPGFTALHLAAFNNDMNTIKLLLNHGSDIDIKDANEITPFDILIPKLRVQDLRFILSTKKSWKNILLSDGRILLIDLLSAMEDPHEFDVFLKEIDVSTFVPTDSSLWPGYTILHLAVIVSETAKRLTFFDSINNADSNSKEAYENCCREHEKVYLERIEICLKRGADVNMQDVHGWTPIHLAFRQRQMQVVNLILQYYDKIQNSVDKDNLTHLHIACAAKNKSLVEKLLASGADANVKVLPSFKWQSDFYKCIFNEVFNMIGSTPMHVAIGDAEIANLLLSSGGDLYVKDGYGLTPVHRSFVLYSIWEKANELYIWPDKTINIFGHGGRSCLPHYLGIRRHFMEIGSKLLSTTELKESVVDEFGLSNLHIVSLANKSDAVNKLLDLRSDIDVMIASKGYEKLDIDNPLLCLACYAGFTSLHMVNKGYGPETEKLLLERGADILAKRADGTTPIFEQLERQYSANIVNYVSKLKQSDALKKRLSENFGWTLLHVACQLVDYDLAKESLNNGVKVNARTNINSPTYPGCTALHILMRNCQKSEESRMVEKNLQRIMRLLLDKGADVMITDVEQSTSVHRADYIPGYLVRSYRTSVYTESALRHVNNFNVNPVNREGMSVFHIACIRHDVEVVKRYLQKGVDVNKSIEFFGSWFNGCTPLHLAARHLQKSFNSVSQYVELIEILLEHGADVFAENSFGETPLHAAAECHSPKKIVFEMIFKAGAKINAQNIYGKTPFEVLLRSRNASTKVIEFFLKNGCHANRFNPISQAGYIPMFFFNGMKASTNSVLKTLLSCPSIRGVDEMGRNALQNIVSNDDFYSEDDVDIIEYCTKRGCDIDYQDKSGKTALHLAAQFRSSNAVEALLMHGADINIVDRSGKTAYSYTLEPESLCDMTDWGVHNHHLVIESFVRYVLIMQFQGLHINEINQQVHLTAMSQFNLRMTQIGESLQSIKDEKISSTSLKLGDFMSETSAIVHYPKMPPSERKKIKKFFTITIKDHDYSNWRFVCQLQYRKALARSQLVKRARVAMPVILGFPFPDLCFDVLEKLLPNAELKSLIEAAI